MMRRGWQGSGFGVGVQFALLSATRERWGVGSGGIQFSAGCGSGFCRGGGNFTLGGGSATVLFVTMISQYSTVLRMIPIPYKSLILFEYGLYFTR
jgi:hypothetical protein